MKVMETITIPPKPAETKEVFSHVLCDLCGQRGSPEYDGEVDWPEATGDNSQVKTTVMIKEGYSFPEGGHWDLKLFDICHSCFREKLMPWLEDQGAKPRQDEIDW